MDTSALLPSLVVATFVRRPYVFAFLGVSTVAGVRDLGWPEAARFAAWTFAVAWAAEFASTRVGIPFGQYVYTETTRHQELYISNVPFFDSVSFVFLAYAAYCLARLALGRVWGVGLVVLGAVLMMFLDVVIDPLAVRGDRWFLGRIFYYPDGGALFGVPPSNYGGWLVVGALAIGGFMLGRKRVTTGRPASGAALYYAILAFNLAMTWWIGESTLFALGAVLHLSVGFILWCWYAVGRARMDDLASYQRSRAGAR